jgi:MFS family permease
VLAERYGPRAFMTAGLALQASALAWIAVVATASTTFGALVVPFAMAGVGMSLVFAPSASALLSVVTRTVPGRRPGRTTRSARSAACSASRVLSTIFASAGGFASRRRSSTASCPRSGPAPASAAEAATAPGAEAVAVAA